MGQKALVGVTHMEGVLSEIMGQKALLGVTHMEGGSFRNNGSKSTVGVTHVQGVLSEMGQKALVGVTIRVRKNATNTPQQHLKTWRHSCHFSPTKSATL